MLLLRHIRSLGSKYSVAEKNDLLDQQCKLEARLTNYEHQMSGIMKLDDDIRWSSHGKKIQNSGPELDDIHDDLIDLDPDGWFIPETERITLPSALAPGEIECLSLKDIANIEFELQKGQVADSLDGLRLALGEKSLCFQTEVRNADSQWTTSRA